MENPLLRMSLELPDQAASVPFCRRIHHHVFGELGVDPDRAADIEVAISEATTNVVQHAYSHPGHHYFVRVDFFPDFVLLVVEDEGQGFARSDVPEPLVDRIDGRGVWLIEQLADEVSFASVRSGGCRLEARFGVSAPLSLPHRDDSETAASALDEQ